MGNLNERVLDAYKDSLRNMTPREISYAVYSRIDEFIGFAIMDKQEGDDAKFNENLTNAIQLLHFINQSLNYESADPLVVDGVKHSYGLNNFVRDLLRDAINTRDLKPLNNAQMLVRSFMEAYSD